MRWLNGNSNTLIRLGLGCVFVLSSYGKLVNLDAFIVVVQTLSPLPPSFAAITGLAVAVFEFQLALFLILGLHPRTALWACCALLGFFMMVVLVPLVQGRDVSCGCFGAYEPLTWWTMARQIFLLVASGWCLLNSRTGPSRRAETATRAPGASVRLRVFTSLPIWVATLVVVVFGGLLAGATAAWARGVPEVVSSASITDRLLGCDAAGVGERVTGDTHVLRLREVVSFVSEAQPQSDLIQIFWSALAESLPAGASVSVLRAGDNPDMAQRFRVCRTPVTFFVSDGVVAYRRTGFALAWWKELHELTASFLFQEPFDPPDIEGGLAIGSTVRTFTVSDEQGVPVTFEEGALRGCVFYFTSVDCSVCDDVAPWIRRFYETECPTVSWTSVVLGAVDGETYSAGYDALARHVPQGTNTRAAAGPSVTLTQAVHYARDHGLPGRVLVDVDGLAQRVLGVGGTPAVIVFGADGRVLARHIIGTGEAGHLGQSFGAELSEEILDALK